MNQTYSVAVRKGSEVIQFWETSHTMIEVTGLQPGVLYNVTVTPCACGSQGVALHISVRTGKNCANNQREVDSSGAFNFFLKTIYSRHYIKLHFVHRIAVW